MLAMGLAASFGIGIDIWATPEQRGFIRGRSMLQNVIDIEHSAIMFARVHRHSAAAFFDFAAAFPSLS
eukprot:8246331-Karenia_brevis.AAC.1